MSDILMVAEATAGRKSVEFLMLDSSGNPITGLTSADITAWLRKDGTGGAGTGTCAEVDSTNQQGLYEYIPSTEEKAAGGKCTLTVSASGAGISHWPFKIVGNDIYQASASTTDIKNTLEASGGKLDTLTVRLSSTRAGYLDALAVAGLVAAQSDVQSLQFNTRVDVPIPPQLVRPAVGSPAIVYEVPINLYDSVGNMEAPDSTPTLTAALADGTSLSANVGALTNPGSGRYVATYTVADDHPKSQVIFTLTVREGGVDRVYTRSFMVVEDILLSFTLGDRTILQALDGRIDDARGALLDNLSRLDVATSTLSTPAQARAQVDAALTAYGAAKPGAAMALTAGERTAIRAEMEGAGTTLTTAAADAVAAKTAAVAVKAKTDAMEVENGAVSANIKLINSVTLEGDGTTTPIGAAR